MPLLTASRPARGNVSDPPGGLDGAIARAKARQTQQYQADQARVTGAREARTHALGVMKLCESYHRPDLFAAVIEQPTLAAAEAAIIDSFWATGQASARAGVRPA